MVKRGYRFKVLAWGLGAVSSGACDDDGSNSELEQENFSNPGEIVKNPSVDNAADEASITINKGEDPPALAGEYQTNGEYTQASSEFSQLEGRAVNSTFCFFDQMSGGEISFEETTQQINIGGEGSFITGDGDQFTVYGESRQIGHSAGLPEGEEVTVVLLISGEKTNDGNLEAKGITIPTKASSERLKELKGEWYMWEAEFDLEGECE